MKKFYAMPFVKYNNPYIQKAERKGRTKQEVDEIIFWLFGYDEAPSINKNDSMIKGDVCGVRV